MMLADGELDGVGVADRGAHCELKVSLFEGWPDTVMRPTAFTREDARLKRTVVSMGTILGERMSL